MGRPLTRGLARSCLGKGLAVPPWAAGSQPWLPDAGSHLQALAGTAFWGEPCWGARWTALLLRPGLCPAAPAGGEQCTTGSRK